MYGTDGSRYRACWETPQARRGRAIRNINMGLLRIGSNHHRTQNPSNLCLRPAQCSVNDPPSCSKQLRRHRFANSTKSAANRQSRELAQKSVTAVSIPSVGASCAGGMLTIRRAASSGLGLSLSDKPARAAPMAENRTAFRETESGEL